MNHQALTGRQTSFPRSCKVTLLVLLTCIATAICLTTNALGAFFTYQGRLNNNGSPANGSYDLTFTLFATNTSGIALAGPLTNTAVAVSNGLFTTMIDFGNLFTDGSNWLEIAVSTNGANAFSTLAPRQQLTPVPLAIFANSASNVLGTVPASQISGSIPASQISGTIPLTQLPSSLVTNAAVVALGQAVFVAKSGNDETGMRGRLDKPFLTLSAAKAAAVAGDTITVYPGNYNSHDLLKNGVDWYFMEGATNNYQGVADGFIFGDHDISVTSNVAGSGTFIWSSTATPSDVECGILGIFNSNSVVSFAFRDIIIDRDDTDSLSTLISGVRVFNCRYVNVRGNSITCIPADNGSTGIWWVRGEFDSSVDRITAAGGSAAWGDEDTVFANWPSTSWYLECKYLQSTAGGIPLYYYPDSNRGRFWVTTQEIKATEAYAIQKLSSSVAGFPGGGGRFYVIAEKVSNTSVLKPAISLGGANTGYNWFQIQKISSSFGFIEGLGGTNHIEVMHYEPTGAATNGIKIADGDWFISGQELQVTNGTGIYFTGGRARIDNLVIDTGRTTDAATHRPVVVTANGLTLHNAVLVAPSLADSIYAGTPKNVGIYGGVMANKDKHANITLAPLGTFTVDSNVK